MKKNMKLAGALLLAGIAGLSAGLVHAQQQVQEIKSLRLDSPTMPANGTATLRVEFSTSSSASLCGVLIDWGNGARQEIRLGMDSYKDSPFMLNQVYPNPGSYTIKLEGKYLQRGLRSAAACVVSAAPVVVKVTDPVAEKQAADQRAAKLAAEAALRDAAIREQEAAARERAALRDAAIREQEAAARERAALADAERAKQDLLRQQAAAREMEIDLKRKELERREAQLRKDEEARRAVVVRPAAPAAQAPAPPPAAPVGGRPPVKAADGF